MESLWFWRKWPTTYQRTWYFIAGIFMLSLLFLWSSYFVGIDAVIQWDTVEDQKIVESTIHTFNVGPFELNVPGDNYLLSQYFNGTNITPNVGASYLFLAVIIICAIVLLTVFTTLERFWYFVAMGLFILFVVSLRLEVLSIFGLRNQIPTIATLVLLGGVSFFFNRIKPSTSLPIRFSAFLAIVFVLALIIKFFAGVEYPMLHLAVTAYTPGLIISVLFIFMIAHEVVASFVFLASQGNSKSFVHLFVITFIYLFNVFITYMHEAGLIDWNFVYLNIYLLLSVAAILGIWGFKNRQPLYQNIFSFDPFGGYMFVAVGTICFITIGYLIANGNDPAIRVIRDAVIFSQFGYGLIFLLYILSNFAGMLGQNMNVHKVLYRPNRMPYFTFRFAGLIVVLAFVFYSNWKEYVYHSFSGFYNNIGDLYTLLDKQGIAEAYYEQGRSYGFQNHRSSYTLGKIKTIKNDLEAAQYNYEQANGNRPSPYSLANEANLYLWKKEFFKAKEIGKESVRLFPDNGELFTNLGFTYGKIHNLDSAVYAFNKARDNSATKNIAEANFFALMASELIPVNADSILKSFDSKSNATISNALALATIFDQNFSVTPDFSNTIKLELPTATLLNNYMVRNAKTIDSTFIANAERIISDSLNIDYREALKAPLAAAYYHKGNVTKALSMLAELAAFSHSYTGKFNYIMGLWSLEQGNPELAASYFDYAIEYGFKNANFYKAISLSEAQWMNEALIAWDTVAQSGDANQAEIATRMKRILNATNTIGFNDSEKYQYCRYKLDVNDSLRFKNILSEIENVNYKAKALLDKTQQAFDLGETRIAIQYFNQISGLELTSEALYKDIQFMELRMLASRKEVRLLSTQINEGVNFDQTHYLEKTLYTALLNEMSGDTLNANKNFDIVGTYNPYFVEGLIAASTYFREHSTDRLKAYTLLAEAIQINNSSVKLLKAYAAEALRVGFDDYAIGALQRVHEIENRK